jgi:hypothetical protein
VTGKDDQAIHPLGVPQLSTTQQHLGRVQGDLFGGASRLAKDKSAVVGVEAVIRLLRAQSPLETGNFLG